MKLLVTGGAGFIGSFLSEALLGAGHSVVSLDDLSTGTDKNLINLTGKPGFKFINGTMMDENLVRDLISDVDGVFHLGAALGVKRILERPYESLVTNMHGTEIVLKAAAGKKVRTFLASTSVIPATTGPLIGSSLKSKYSSTSLNKSRIFSLYISNKETVNL